MTHVTDPHPLLPSLTVPGECRSLSERWSAVAGAVPERIAIQSAEASYSFAETDAIAARLAGTLAPRLGPGNEPVALFVDNTATALIAILAMLKSDRLFTLLDGHQPLDRLRQIATVAGSTHCLADDANLLAAQGLDVGLREVIALDALVKGEAAAVSRARAAAAAPPGTRAGADPVSIVFTSGSTGGPKGVLQTHDQFLNEVFNKGRRFRLSPDDRVGILLPFAFAAGFSALMAALLNGAGVWTYDARDSGIAPLPRFIAENQLTAVHCTPHLLRALSGALAGDSPLTSVRYVCSVAEAVFGGDVERIRPFLPATASFFNETGSSEMGTLALHEIAGADPLPAGQVPAGQLVANKEVWLLRDDGSIAAPGEAGEITVVSDYLSGGYWRNAAGNAERFGVSSDGRRTCRQGDLARFDANGDLMLLGRADVAVKIRGYLVEPSEVEAAILASDSVAEAAVVAVSSPMAATRLVAYVAPRSEVRTEAPAALRRRLRERLPEYMIPAVIVQLPQLPRNERGKVDRQALPAAPAEVRSKAPTSQWELVVADVWQRVLGLTSIGVDDDFMALGGDSLTAEEMLAAIGDITGTALTSRDLITAPTLREFTQRVQHGSKSLPSHPDVVLLQDSNSDLAPLFCFAGSGGLALTFSALARLFPDRQVYAFQAHGLERRAFPDWSVRATANRYLEFIRAVQPHGPYVFIGHSFGGLVAMELALRLTEVGEPVDLVGILDTYLPRSAGVVPVAMTASRAAGPTPRHRRSKPGVATALTGRWRSLQSRIVRRLRALVVGLIRFDGQTHFDAFFDQGVIISGRYRVRPYPGRTLVIFADKNPNQPAEWDAILTGPHEFSSIRSEHSSMMREPHIGQLAATVRTVLTEVTGPIYRPGRHAARS